MKSDYRTSSENGFTMVELLISLLILMVLIGAVVNLFSVAINQHQSEQTSIASTQDARGGLEIMTQEISQAGSHPGKRTTVSVAYGASDADRTITVSSTSGFMAGDFVDLGNAGAFESVQLTAVGSNTFTGGFAAARNGGDVIRLYAQPFLYGVIKPAGLGANSSATVTTLRFFGDVNGDGTIDYVEYVYDAANSEITRSNTAITQASINPAVPLIRNVKPNSAQFRLYTDSMGVVTSVRVSLTVQNTWREGNKLQEAQLSSKILIPSAVSASALQYDVLSKGCVNKIPPTPPQVTTWANR